jgi:hypothetical protein
MELKATVLAEDVQTRDKIEYVTVTCLEQSEKPLLQMLDYGLRNEELSHKGKLVGKSVNLHIQNIRAIFSGRPQCSGHLTVVAGK